MSNLAIANWFKTVINDEELDVTILPKPELNGYSSRPEVNEAIESILLVRKQGGKAAVKTIWTDQISKTIPDIAAVVDRPKYIYHCSELAMLPPIRWLIEGEVPKLGFSVLYGQPEVGKTFLSIQYAERIAQREPVVYCMGEGRSGYTKRHEAFLKHNKSKPGALYFVDKAFPLTETAQLELFIEDIRQYKPSLVIFDTLARYFNGEENSAKDMGQFVSACDRIRSELQTAVLVVHHSGKAGGERGSSALRGAADSMIEVIDEDNRIKVVCSKSKDRKHFEPYYLQRVEIILEPGVSSCVLLPVGMVAEKKDEFTNNQRLVLETLYDNPLYDRGAKFSQLKIATGLGDSSLNNALKSLAKRHLIRKTGQYEPYALTDEGITMCRMKGVGR